jgi:hypothetical protein
LFFSDSGSGFDYSKLNDRLLDGNQMYGRGINIVGSLSSEMIFMGKGNEVCVVMNG